MDAHYNLGVAYLNVRDKSSALDQYKILKDLDKDSANELFNLIYEWGQINLTSYRLYNNQKSSGRIETPSSLFVGGRRKEGYLDIVRELKKWPGHL